MIPAVDLLGEEAVRLERGSFDRVTVREANPRAFVERYAGAGASLIHLVDLDGARSGSIRPGLVRRLVMAAAPAAIQASGGIRSVGDAQRLLGVGAARVVVGTAAFAAPDALPGLVSALGDRLVVAIDVRGDRIAVSGWEREGPLTPEQAAEACAAAGVPRLLCTAVERDGTLGGPDLDLLRRLLRASGLPVLAAGGVRARADLDAIAAAGCEGAIVGRALLEGRIPLSLLSRTARESTDADPLS